MGEKKDSTLGGTPALAATGAGSANWARAGQNTKNHSHGPTMKSADGWGLFFVSFFT